MMHIVMIIRGQVRHTKEWRKVPNKYKQVTITTTNKTNTMNRKRKKLMKIQIYGTQYPLLLPFVALFSILSSTNLNTLHHCL